MRRLSQWFPAVENSRNSFAAIKVDCSGTTLHAAEGEAVEVDEVVGGGGAVAAGGIESVKYFFTAVSHK